MLIKQRKRENLSLALDYTIVTSIRRNIFNLHSKEYEVLLYI